MKIAFFGSSLVSARWNGAATYYRGILRALAARGHRTVFYEPDAYGRQEHRDIEDPDFAEVVVYSGTAELEQALQSARSADLVVKASGVGENDALLEGAVLSQRRAGQSVVFWDVDAPATLERLRLDPEDPFLELVPSFDLVFTYGGGRRVIEEYLRLGARGCVPIYNAVDPETHHPVLAESRFQCDLAFLANRLPDREARADAFFFDVAAREPGRKFVLGGSGWEARARPSNIDYLGHVFTYQHNAFNASALAVLNVNRSSMADVGYSPATRIFEAAGAGACIISDAWDGIEQFLEPEREILIARNTDEVIEHLRALTPERRAAIGARALARVLGEHTYDRRALEVEAALGVEDVKGLAS
jgi:spore maturation protein CgeB